MPEKLDRTGEKKTFTEICINAGMPENIAKKAVHYRSRHKNVSEDEIIRLFLNYENTIGKESFKDKCRKAGLESFYSSLNKHKNNHPELTEEDVIQSFINSGKHLVKREKKVVEAFGVIYKSTKEVLEKFDLDVSRAYFEKYIKTNNITIEEAIIYFKNNYKPVYKQGKKITNRAEFVNIDGIEYTCADAIKKFNLSNSGILTLMNNNGITRAEAIKLAIRTNKAKINKVETFIYNGKTYSSKSACLNELKISDTQINYYIESKSCKDIEEAITKILKYRADKEIKTTIKTFKNSAELCEYLKIPRRDFEYYKQNYDELKNIEIIALLRPDCYINILGELVIPE